MFNIQDRGVACVHLFLPLPSPFTFDIHDTRARAYSRNSLMAPVGRGRDLVGGRIADGIGASTPGTVIVCDRIRGIVHSPVARAREGV